MDGLVMRLSTRCPFGKERGLWSIELCWLEVGDSVCKNIMRTEKQNTVTVILQRYTQCWRITVDLVWVFFVWK